MKTNPRNNGRVRVAMELRRGRNTLLRWPQGSILRTFLLLTVLAGGTFKVNAQATLTLTFEGSFERYYGSATSTVNADAWAAFRASLLGTYTYTGFKMSGSQNTTGISCTDPAVATAVAAALRTGGSYVGSSDGQTWRVGICTVTGTDCIEITNTASVCACNTGYAMRPEISNGNWGGIVGVTCDGLSQTMKMEFFYESCSTPSAITGNTPVCI